MSFICNKENNNCTFEDFMKLTNEEKKNKFNTLKDDLVKIYFDHNNICRYYYSVYGDKISTLNYIKELLESIIKTEKKLIKNDSVDCIKIFKDNDINNIINNFNDDNDINNIINNNVDDDNDMKIINFIVNEKERNIVSKLIKCINDDFIIYHEIIKEDIKNYNFNIKTSMVYCEDAWEIVNYKYNELKKNFIAINNENLEFDFSKMLNDILIVYKKILRDQLSIYDPQGCFSILDKSTI